MVMNDCYALCAVMSLIVGSYFPFEEKKKVTRSLRSHPPGLAVPYCPSSSVPKVFSPHFISNTSFYFFLLINSPLFSPTLFSIKRKAMSIALQTLKTSINKRWVPVAAVRHKT